MPGLVVIVFTPRVTEQEEGVVDFWRSVRSGLSLTDVEGADDGICVALDDTAVIMNSIITGASSFESHEVACLVGGSEARVERFHLSICSIGSQWSSEGRNADKSAETVLKVTSVCVKVVSFDLGPSLLEHGTPNGSSVLASSSEQEVISSLVSCKNKVIIDCDNPWLTSDVELDSTSTSCICCSSCKDLLGHFWELSEARGRSHDIASTGMASLHWISEVNSFCFIKQVGLCEDIVPSAPIDGIPVKVVSIFLDVLPRVEAPPVDRLILREVEICIFLVLALFLEKIDRSFLESINSLGTVPLIIGLNSRMTKMTVS